MLTLEIRPRLGKRILFGLVAYEFVAPFPWPFWDCDRTAKGPRSAGQGGESCGDFSGHALWPG